MSEMAQRELPEGWKLLPLMECVEILDSKRIPINSKERSERIEGVNQEELYPYYGATGQVGYIDDFIFDGEYLLIGEDGAPFFDKRKNVTYIAKGRFWVNNHAHILNARSNISFNKYLLYYLNSFNYTGFVAGTTRLKLNQSDLRKIPIAVAPIDQQKRIVAKIEELFSHIDAGVDGLKKTQRLLKQYRQSVLKAAVTGELTKEWREENKNKLELAENFLKRIIKEKIEKKQGKNKKSEMIDVANLATLPDEWCWAKTDQMGFIQLGRQRAPKYHNGANMKPYLRVQNVFEDRIDLDDVMEMDFPPSDYEKYQLKYNDILLNEGQSPELLGRPAIYRGELPNGCFTNTLIRFQVASGLLPEYALLVFRHFMHSGRFKKAGTITTNIGHLSAGRFSEIEFPLCSTLEQEEIVRITDDKLLRIKRLEDDVDRLLRRADRNKQSILKDVFMGNYPDVQN